MRRLKTLIQDTITRYIQDHKDVGPVQSLVVLCD